MDRSEMVELVSRLSGEELRELNKIVIGSLRARRSIEVFKFAVGDRVQFEAKGVLATGEVTKLNQKSVGVDAEEPFDRIGNWRVSPSLLTKI